MGLREWAADAVENGGTLRWFLGLGVQIAIEAAASVLFGYIATHAFLLVFPLDAITPLVGGYSFDVVWASATVVLLVEGTLGTYARGAE